MSERKVFLLLIGGVSGSGKTSLAAEIIEKINNKKRVCVIDMDGYYDNPPENIDGKDWDWDSPKAFENGIHLLTKHLEILKSGGTVKVPKHDYANYKMIPDAIEISNVDVIVIEGILTLYFEQLRKLADHIIYVGCDDDTVLARRIIRDVTIRGYNQEMVIERYNTFVKPAAEQYIKPFKKLAHIEVPNYNNTGIKNHPATDMIACYILNKLDITP